MSIRKKIFILLSVILLIALAVFISLAAGHYFTSRKQLLERKNAWVRLEEKVRNETGAFNRQTGVIVKDLSTGWQIKINEDKLFPSASMVKVPIMASYILASSRGEVNLNLRLALKNRDKALGSGILKDYAAGTEFSIADLIEIMVTHSDNTAANILIDYFGLARLNSYFKQLGLNNTNISRKMMDFRKRRAGVENFTSAGDLAYLLEEIYYNRLVNREFSQMCLGILKRQKIRDRIPAKLPLNTPIAHKTGLERGVCHDAGIVFTPGGDFIVCVLTKHDYKISRPAKKFISNIARDVYNYCCSG
jgi:beta-lactamase class A